MMCVAITGLEAELTSGISEYLGFVYVALRISGSTHLSILQTDRF